MRSSFFETLFSLIPLNTSFHSSRNALLAEPADRGIFRSGRPPLPTVHVLDLPDDLNTALLQCYKQRYGAVPWDDTQPHGTCGNSSDSAVCGDHLATESSQYSADVLLHAAMLRHATERPVRAGQADVIWVPFYNMLSAHFQRGDCATGLDHHARLALLNEHLRQHPLLATRGRHFALALPRTRALHSTTHR